MLQVKHLTLVQIQDQKTLIRDLSFSLQAGQRLAVIGAEGNGKSSLLRLLHDPESVASYLCWTGEIFYAPHRLGFLEQEAGPEFLAAAAADLFSPHAAESELYRLASLLNLDHSLLFDSRPLQSFSGGERLKVRLLLLLLQEPDILLLDEPGNDLDLEGLAWLEQFLREAPQAILYISHDETLLARTATSILHIEQIWRRTEPRATLSGLGFEAYMDQFLGGIERQNARAAKEEQDYRRKLERYREIEAKVNADLNSVSRQDPHGGRLLKKKMQAVKATGRRFERQHEHQTQRTDREDEVDFFLEDLPGLPADKEVLRLDLPELRAGGRTLAVDVQLLLKGPELRAGARTLAADVQLLIKGPEHLGITGANGCGKSTLLKEILTRLRTRPDLTVFYMPQSLEDLFLPGQRPLEFLVPDGDKILLQEASNLLGSMHFAREEAEREIRLLSGGQKIKLLFAKLRLSEANVLVLDEPTRHLSPLSNPVLRAGLAAYSGAIISVSHDRRYLSEVCDRVLRLTAAGLREEDPRLYQSE